MALIVLGLAALSAIRFFGGKGSLELFLGGVGALALLFGKGFVANRGQFFRLLKLREKTGGNT